MSKKSVASVLLQGKVDAQAYITANGYPTVGKFADKKTLQKFYKQLDTEVLLDWMTQEKLTYTACPENEMIDRMRVCMKILYKFFPKVSAPKKVSIYAKFTLENLVDLALQNDLAVETTDNDRIMRMRLIMVLRANKVVD